MDPDLSATLLPEPASLRGSIAELLRERIVTGQFKPGERVIEAEIARSLQTSRGPVREALAELRAEGLIVERPRHGSFVAVLTDDDVAEIYELRAALEGRAAKLIIERGDDAALLALATILGDLRDAARRNDRPKFAQLDAHFHAELCRLSGNNRLYRAFVQYAGLLGVLFRIEITTQYETLDEILDEHVVLLAEIDSRDPARATAACDRHLTRALAHVQQMRPGG